MKFNLPISSFMNHHFTVVSKILWPNPSPFRFFPVLGYTSFKVLHFTFRSIVHFKFIYAKLNWGAQDLYLNSFFLYTWVFSVPTTFVERFFSLYFFFASLLKISSLYLHGCFRTFNFY